MENYWFIIKYKANMLERRVHYRRQNHYNTKSNKYKIVKTPGKYHSIRLNMAIFVVESIVSDRTV